VARRIDRAAGALCARACAGPGLRDTISAAMPEPIRRDLANTVRLGVSRRPLADLYYNLMRRRWSWLFAFLAAAYLVINLGFATLFRFDPTGLSGVERLDFAQAFYFSVQTFATIGYGAIAPKSLYANLLVTFEALFGIIYTALATGLVFAKFSRPSTRVTFSRNITVAPRNGRPMLQFRLANERGNELIEASIHVTMLKTEVSAEGHRMRRLHEMKLDRTSQPLFSLSWLVLHEIDEQSPVYGEDQASLAADEALFIVTLTGIDGTFAQTVHARHLYEHHDILWGHRFVDIISAHSPGRLQMDMAKMHDVVPVDDR
jgi:inward rectifier potassium channel